MHIKERPEDFVVVEKSIVAHEKDDCIIIDVEKRDWDTTLLVRELARRCGVSHKSVGYAGLKDKRAVTRQKMSVYGVDEETVTRVRIPGASIAVVGRGDRIEVGDLGGNTFDIVVRGIEMDTCALAKLLDASVQRLETDGGFVNYFGYQRFGLSRPVTADVGKALVRKDYEDAVRTYIGAAYPADPYREVRSAFLEGMGFKEAYIAFPPSLSYERAMLFSLYETGGDYRRALLALPSRLLMLFVHAYQSALFNRIVEARLETIPVAVAELGDMIVMERQGTRAFTTVNASNMRAVQARLSKDISVACPLLGHRSVLPRSTMGRIAGEILESEGMSLQDFENKDMPVLGSSGSGREILARCHDLSYQINGQAGDLSCSTHFTLGKGSYATVFLQQLFGCGIYPAGGEDL